MPIYTKNNDWGGNSISKLLFDYLLDTLPQGKIILELGSGWGTSKLMEHWEVISIEDNPKYYKKYNPTSFLVPRLGRGQWYDPQILASYLEGVEYDLLLVDGPDGPREGLIENIHLFDTSVPFVFDDVRRTPGRTLGEELSKIIGRPFVIFGYERSMFGVIDAVQGLLEC